MCTRIIPSDYETNWRTRSGSIRMLAGDSQAGGVPLALHLVDQPGDLAGDLTEVLIRLLLVELDEPLAGLVQADGRRRGVGRVRARRRVCRGEVVVVLLGMDQGLVDRLDERSFVPAGVTAVLAEDRQGHVAGV